MMRKIPSLMTYIGIAEVIIAIPVKWFLIKLKCSYSYNNQNATGYKQFNEPRLDLITNLNGIGLRLTLN
jgi:hypothetical protein